MQSTTPGNQQPSALKSSSADGGLSRSGSRRTRRRRGSIASLYALGFALIVVGVAVWFGGGLSIRNVGRMIISSVSLNHKFLYSGANEKEIVIDDIAIDSLLDTITFETERSRPLRLQRVAVGYNTNLDMVVGASHSLIPFFRSLLSKQDLEELSTTTDHPKITSAKQLAETFAYHFVKGIAAERFIEDPNLFSEVISFILKEMDNEFYQFHPGGNAALMGNKFGELGVKVLLGGPVGTRLKHLLQPNVVPLAKFQTKEQQPTNEEEEEEVEGILKELQKDEIHLIIEFGKGAKWKLGLDRILESPRANRFIVSHDTTNSHLLALEPFHSALEPFGEDLVVLAGTHLCEAIDHKLTVLNKVIDKVVESKANNKKKAIHFELASVGDALFFQTMVSKIIPTVDSIGLNEQELYHWYQTAKSDNRMNNIGEQQLGQSIFGHTLHLDTAISALKTVLTWEKAVMNGRLSRVHLHSLAFHMICQLNKTGDYYEWSNDRALSAVAAGSLATTYQACADANQRPLASKLEVHSEVFSPNYIANDISTLNLSTHVLDGSSESFSWNCYISPVLVCKTPIRTVGLGDAISATGLAYHF